MVWVLVSACLVASVPAGLRWLRVAQREHYLAPSTSRFAWRWWIASVGNQALFGASLVGLVGAIQNDGVGILVPLAQIGPIGLPVRGTTSPLAWTGRLKRVAGLAGVLFLVLTTVGGLIDSQALAVAPLLFLPLIIDASLVLLAPIEKTLGSSWVEKASKKLDASGAEVVAITGSYGKTTTKAYVAHLLAGSRRTVASPASFNNRMGLARAINEGLAPGTEVFVAEMGTYGPGEIAELCEWIPPKVAAMVAIGPVHLERFRTEERIVSAKAEILELAEIGVICVDHPLLAELSSQRAATMEIIEVSTGTTGRVRVGEEIVVDDRVLRATPNGVFRTNLAVALGISLALGVEVGDVIARLADLPVAEHRQSVTRSERGVSIIDDTFNSNPAGARRALGVLSDVGAGGKTAVVSPGMVELGPRQREENRDFAEEASQVADHLIIVGRTNRFALREGSVRGTASVTVVDSRGEAVDWVREHLGQGDAVLYENDLPDHYP
ncbi:MAG: Mur ligase family protein [Actinomycetota bacterium]|nr:Mur ligase family protein [Actinomycetota bacterium]